MAKVISLFNYEGQKREQPYLLFQTEATQNLHCVSPDLMQLTSDIYVADLHIVQNYWQKRAELHQVSVDSLITETLQDQLTGCRLLLFCDHPFQGLIFFNHLQMFDAEGVFRCDSLFSEKTYQNMSWHPWRLSARQINDRFEELVTLKKERKSFLSQLKRFETFTNRVDIKEFHALKQAHFFEISRRFKGFLGLLWQWTFPMQEQESESTASLFNFQHYQKLQGFPWFSFREQEPVKVTTSLEFPVSDWQNLETQLLEDLIKIRRCYQQKPSSQLMGLTWTINLYDMSQITRNLCFKYPVHWPAEEEKSYQGLLAQLQLSFQQLQTQLNDRAQEIEMINTALIVGWSLTVTHTLTLSEKNRDLFGDVEGQKIFEDIKTLENKVKGSIQSFQLENNFIPGFDFSERGLTDKAQNPEHVTHLTLARPFYIFPDPVPLAADQILFKQFLDRTSSDWWNNKNDLDSLRDCYLCELKTRQVVFAYRNYCGEWFQYGL